MKRSVDSLASARHRGGISRPNPLDSLIGRHRPFPSRLHQLEQRGSDLLQIYPERIQGNERS